MFISPVRKVITRFSIVLFTVLIFGSITAQEKLQWTEIYLLDTPPNFSSSDNDYQNAKYPAANLFDRDFSTCWVANAENNSYPYVFVKMPNLNNWVVNIFSGYGKSEELFYKNSRPRKIRISVFAAINPTGGFVTEIATVYKAIQFPKKIDIELIDSFGVQSIPLNISKEELNSFLEKSEEYFGSTFNMDVNKKCLILKLEIIDTWKGTHYDDICISELFFNNIFVTFQSIKPRQISNVYISDAENALLIDDNTGKGIVVYQDKESILQLIDVSHDKKWAILISMAAEIEGRAETFYLLVDLVNKEVVNNMLEKCLGNYLSGSELFFDDRGSASVFLMYNFENLIELK